MITKTREAKGGVSFWQILWFWGFVFYLEKGLEINRLMQTLWCAYNAILVAMVPGGCYWGGRLTNAIAWNRARETSAEDCLSTCQSGQDQDHHQDQDQQDQEKTKPRLFVKMPIWPRSTPPPRLRLRPRKGQGQGKQQHQEKDQDHNAILTTIKATQNIPISVLNILVNMCFLEKFTPPANILHCRR